MAQLVGVREVSSQGFYIDNFTAPSNIYTTIRNSDIAVGFWDILTGTFIPEQKGLAMFSYDPKGNYESQRGEITKTLDKFLDGIDSPKIIIVAIEPEYGEGNESGYAKGNELGYPKENEMLRYIQKHLKKLNPYVEQSDVTEGGVLIESKDIVLGRKDLRIVPRKDGKLESVDDIIRTSYRELFP